ncbi:hypothetical protein PFICI_01035 [Pestalotiopsis fici W106-1]|uniref:Uncharacterized protein n=1 Tax=Pestalotiopsis fici (strain W106-1 / CGMCC3.15140) TaxID=1229662 RepID=W3XNX1_PESFW|nr:uncharacterized protein PFICI_01035 [Pestalotiopsis fici W106-1]ETS87207.1 hypothetical protein PFICI_01035 [Pestalotiopsis fici W106-1]
MAPSLGAGPWRNNQNVDLVIRTARSISEIARLLRPLQTNIDLMHFYGNLNVHCVLVKDQMKRLKFILSPANDLVAQALNLFESLVSTQGVPQDSALMLNYSKQRALNQRWDVLRNQENDAKVRFIDQCFNVVKSPGLRPGQALDESFRAWEDHVFAAYPEDRSQWLIEDLPPKKVRDEPPYVVWSTANSLYTALTKSANCGCHQKHELGATLCLGTYRNPESENSSDFDMCFSREGNWQEARVYTTRESVVRFSLNDKPPPPQKQLLDYKPLLVKKELCEHIKGKSLTSRRLELRFEDDCLFKLLSAKGKLWTNSAEPTVSLQQFIDDRFTSQPTRTRVILAVLLSYAVLHLHGTPWLQPTWNSSHILFFRTRTSIPLRPYIRTQLGTEGIDPDWSHPKNQKDGDNLTQHPDPSNEVSPDDSDPDNLDYGDLDPDDIEHPFPALVTLAIILMEIYTKTPFGELAKNCDMPLPELPDSRTRLSDVVTVFTESKIENIAENSKFCNAIEKCLQPRVWRDECGEPMDDQTLRTAIYREVVTPLEDELCDAFKTITIEELDQMAKEVDIGNWGQPIQSRIAEEMPPKTASPAIDEVWPQRQGHLIGSEVRFHDAPFAAWNHRSQEYLPPFFDLKQNPAQESEYDSARFYDDERPSEAHSRAELLDYLTWKAKYKKVYEKYIERSPQSVVRVAILDSGVDDGHDLLKTGQIKDKYNWTTAAKNKKVAHDRDGHGTFVASLLIDYAPDAELYIAKIAEKELSSPRIIAKAIEMAVNDWKVDIISMSFGYPTNQIDGYEELKKALEDAHCKHVLMFAAASNSGANLGRAYPAREPQVICVHSTDSHGNRSKFSPTAHKYNTNFATIGEAVESAWPVNLCDRLANPQFLQLKSGTSYATPIVSGIAAFLLQYARFHLADMADVLKRKDKMEEVLLEITKKTPTTMARDDYHYISLSLYSDNLFAKGKRFIDATLTEILKR